MYGRATALLAAYCHAVDTCDWDRVAACFEDDAVVVRPQGQVAGRPAILASLQAAVAALPPIIHLLHPPYVVPCGEGQLRSRAYTSVVSIADAAPGVLLGTALYDDEVTEVAGVLRIRRRTLSTWMDMSRAFG